MFNLVTPGRLCTTLTYKTPQKVNKNREQEQGSLLPRAFKIPLAISTTKNHHGPQVVFVNGNKPSALRFYSTYHWK